MLGLVALRQVGVSVPWFQPLYLCVFSASLTGLPCMVERVGRSRLLRSMRQKNHLLSL